MTSGSTTSGTPNPPATPKQNTAKTTNPATPKKDDLTNKLGSDGKLTPQERQRRIDRGLCLLCGQSGHMVRECPRSMKARAAATETLAILAKN